MKLYKLYIEMYACCMLLIIIIDYNFLNFILNLTLRSVYIATHECYYSPVRSANYYLQKILYAISRIIYI